MKVPVVHIEDRQSIWDAYKGPTHKDLKRTFLQYTRYFEANCIVDTLKKLDTDFTKLTVLDFGCACGDYGITLARHGATAMFHDKKKLCVDFADYRCDLEGLKHVPYSDNHNFVIFGEVLEHLDNPLAVLKAHGHCQYVFTSSYPFRSDDPQDTYWTAAGHSEDARLQQKPCRDFLRKHFGEYDCYSSGKLKLWIK